MTTPVYLDTGIFVAFLNGRDRWHRQALALFNQPKPHWHTSILVVSETYSWFLHRMGEEAARSFRLLLNNMEAMVIFEATMPHHQLVLKMLDRFRGTKLTYVDAASLCLMEQHKIRQVWSTDHHLSLTGVQVLPRS